MKTLLSEGGRDYIINETTTALFENNKQVWINEEKRLCVYKGHVQSVQFYEHEQGEHGATGKATVHYLDVASIKKLYAAIIEIEARRTEETYYEDYF